MMRKIISCLILLIIVIVIVTVTVIKNNNDTIRIDIGYQSVTSQTWGALVMKHQNIFENKLRKNYPNKKFKVVWHDEISGAVINTNMISHKYQLGFMGDMPLILNMYKSSSVNNYNSVLIAFDGKGLGGKNQSILVSKSSNIKNISDLKGKTISTPIGSSAHFMLLKVLEKNNLMSEVEIIHQDVALASQLLSTNKTDAFSIWAPYPNYLLDENVARVLVNGTESNIDYLAGIIADYDWMKNNQEIVNIFLESLDETHNFINNNREEAARIFSKESGFSNNITKQEINDIKWDSIITDADVQTMIEKKEFLVDLKQIKDFNISNFIYK